MKLETWHNGLKRCVQHIIELKENGDLLMKKGSFSHAYFIYYTALEEMATAYFILDRFNQPSPEELRNIIFSHERKAPLMADKISRPT